MEDDATVVDSGGNERQVSESVYRARGYMPPFYELPWCDAADEQV
jgi:hypothetical protein